MRCSTHFWNPLKNSFETCFLFFKKDSLEKLSMWAGLYPRNVTNNFILLFFKFEILKPRTLWVFWKVFWFISFFNLTISAFRIVLFNIYIILIWKKKHRKFVYPLSVSDCFRSARWGRWRRNPFGITQNSNLNYSKVSSCSKTFFLLRNCIGYRIRRGKGCLITV